MRGLAALATSLAIAAGCGGCSDGNAGDRPTVFAASSLTEVFRSLDPVARYSFAGSDDLAAQIGEGAPADVYASAASKHTEDLRTKNLLEAPRAFATNSVVLIVPRENPADVASVQDLGRNGVKLVVGAVGVPVGDYTRDALARMGESEVLSNVVSNEDDVKGVVGKVAQGEADAGFVYATDVSPVEDEVRSISLPASARAGVEYVIAVVRGAEHRDAARAFVRLVLSEPGQKALRDAGFGPP